MAPKATTTETGLMRSKRGTVDLQINGMSDVMQVGQLFESSGMFGCDQQGQGVVLALTCFMRNMDPLEFQQTYNIIEGKPSMKADAMLAKFIQRGGQHEIVERTPDRAEVKLTKDGQTKSFAFSFAEAQVEPFVFQKDGKTLKKNWRTPRARMQTLWARVISEGVRAMDPTVNAGTYTPEEIEDFGDVTTIPSQEPKATATKQATSTDKVQPPTPPPPPLSTKATDAPEADKTASAQPAEASTVQSSAPANKPVEVVTPEVVKDDPSKCPAGKQQGKKWEELSDAQLAAAAKWNHPLMTEKHRAKVRDTMLARANKAQ